jgi:hypothetical protein
MTPTCDGACALPARSDIASTAIIEDILQYRGKSQKNEVGCRYIFNSGKINIYVRQKKGGNVMLYEIIAASNSELSIRAAPFRRICSSFTLRPSFGSAEAERSGIGDACGTRFRAHGGVLDLG